MKKINTFCRRIILFALSLFVIALGVSMVTHAFLGTAPAACPPYVLSIIPDSPLTMGTYMFIMQALFVLAQIAILRRDFRPLQLFQLLASFLFGFYTDLTMWMTGGMIPSNYIESWILLIGGCAVMGIGIVFEIQASLIMLPGEGIVAAVSKVSGRPFHQIKVVNDVLMTLIGLTIAWYFIGNVAGVREGTIVSAILVGIMVKVFTRPLKPVANWVKTDNNQHNPKLN